MRIVSWKGYKHDGNERAILCFSGQCLIGRVSTIRSLLSTPGKIARPLVCPRVRARDLREHPADSFVLACGISFRDFLFVHTSYITTLAGFSDKF